MALKKTRMGIISSLPIHMFIISINFAIGFIAAEVIPVDKPTFP